MKNRCLSLFLIISIAVLFSNCTKEESNNNSPTTVQGTYEHPICPYCGSNNTKLKTAMNDPAWNDYLCLNCGKWFRGYQAGVHWN